LLNAESKGKKDLGMSLSDQVQQMPLSFDLIILYQPPANTRGWFRETASMMFSRWIRCSIMLEGSVLLLLILKSV
jgi:hypothetical protein